MVVWWLVWWYGGGIWFGPVWICALANNQHDVLPALAAAIYCPLSATTGGHAECRAARLKVTRVTPMTSLVCVFSKPMEDLPVHPCARMIASFLRRIGYSVAGEDEGEDLLFCLHDYRAEPDYFDCRHDGKRGCVRAFYRWGTEWDDPRLHGGRW